MEREPTLGEFGIMAITAGVLAIDALALVRREETISSAFHRQYEKHPLLVGMGMVALAAHLVRWPDRGR